MAVLFKPPERLATGGVRLLLALAVALAGNGAYAHGDDETAIPEQVGWRIGAAGALSYLHGDTALLSARLPGHLLLGDEGIDRRRWYLEHLVADVGWRLSPAWAVAVAAGKHGGERAHIESAFVQWRHAAATDSTWSVQAGRMRPHQGAVITAAGHLDRFALPPLARDATFNGDWIDDGVQASYRTHGYGLDWAADAGVWQGQVFPGSPRADPALHIRLGSAWQTRWGAMDADLVWAGFDAAERGTRRTAIGGGHSHAVPDCGLSMSELVCFDGRSNVVMASLRWQDLAGLPLTAQAAGLWRDERGELYSNDGLARYRGRTTGGWFELAWRARETLSLAVRGERLTARHRLRGAGASLLAADAGFARYAPLNRLVLSLGYQPLPALQLKLEAGEERAGGERSRFIGLRTVFSLDSGRLIF